MKRYNMNGLELIKFEKKDFKAVTQEYIDFAKNMIKSGSCVNCKKCPFHHTNNAIDNENLCGKNGFSMVNVKSFAKYKPL